MNPSSLNSLRAGQSAHVSHIEAEPVMRRRLLDIGLIPGTRVTCTAMSPAGDPAAYLIRGAVIAPRDRDTGGVYLGDVLWDWPASPPAPGRRTPP